MALSLHTAPISSLLEHSVLWGDPASKKEAENLQRAKRWMVKAGKYSCLLETEKPYLFMFIQEVKKLLDYSLHTFTVREGLNKNNA